MGDSTFDLRLPETRGSSVIFASPHSGRAYPTDLMQRSVLDERAIRSSEDAFVDVLFDAAPDHGAPLLAATFPRAYIDLNRNADELDPAVIEDVRLSHHNPRVSSGLGVVPRVVANGRAIYRGKISRADAERRIRACWHPYHATLTDLLAQATAQFGEAILIDCHSMPHEAIESLGQPRGQRAEIVLGDRFGAAAASWVVDRVEEAFLAAGLRVARNAPFAGAYTTQHYGRPSRRQHVVQIEIDRSLYMNEALVRPNGNFAAFKALMDDVVADIAGMGRAAGLQVAAE